jgi:RHS repeat-associated protein
MLARVHSCAVIGLDGVVVEVEVDTHGGLPKTTIVGLPYAAVNESLARAQSFEPFGDVHASAGTAATSYGYTGEWTDATGLVHLRARYLNTGVGRFTSRDTWEGDYNRPLLGLYLFGGSIRIC